MVDHIDAQKCATDVRIHDHQQYPMAACLRLQSSKQILSTYSTLVKQCGFLYSTNILYNSRL